MEALGRVGGNRLITGNLSRILFLTFFFSIHFRTNRMVADFTCFWSVLSHSLNFFSLGSIELKNY